MNDGIVLNAEQAQLIAKALELSLKLIREQFEWQYVGYEGADPFPGLDTNEAMVELGFSPYDEEDPDPKPLDVYILKGILQAQKLLTTPTA